VLFVAFDLEEAGLVGSTAFCQSPPIPLDRVDLFLTADMLGRSLAGVCPRRVFGFGTEYAPDLIALVKRAAGDQTSIRVELIGSDLLLADRSDYGPFRRRRIPFLFFSTGENPHYHKPTDRSESIDYEQLEAASRLVCDLVRIAATTETLPRWGEPAVPPPGEAGAVRQVFQDLLEHRNKMNLPNYQQIMMERAIEMIDVAESERRALTPKERARMLRVAQLVLYTAL
jgi:hypothetical protein